MVVQTITIADYTSSIPPVRFFKAQCLENHIVWPKAVPEFIKSVEFLQGDSTAVGCIKQLNFPEGRPYSYVKDRVDEINYDDFYIKYTSFEGDFLGDRFEYVVYENKCEPSGAGSHFTMTAHYHTKGDFVMKNENIVFARESIKKKIETMEKYLIDNPQVCA